MTQYTEDQIIAITQEWLKDFVIGLNLCPFAALPFNKGGIRFVVETSTELKDLLESLIEESYLLDKLAREEVETTLLIHPNVLVDFETYNSFLGMIPDIIVRSGLEGIIQIASFHPEYRFEGTEAESSENFTNRSPFPMLHLLREVSVEEAVAHHPDPDAIPKRNIALMNEMGNEQLQQLLSGIYQKTLSKQ